MNNRLNEWLETYGRRLAELEISGGGEFFVKGNKDIIKLDGLSGNEWIEFFTLIGQLDGLIWALEPEDPKQAKEFHKKLSKKINDIKKHCKHVLKIAGRLDIQKGEA